MTDSNQAKLKARLSRKAYEVTQNKATEAPFSGAFVNHHEDGMYNCVVCGQQLFASDAKFDSHSGWPSFDQALPDTTKLVMDTSHGMQRTEVVCSNCGSHLGHAFDDGPSETTGQRLCINSCALDFEEKPKNS